MRAIVTAHATAEPAEIGALERIEELEIKAAPDVVVWGQL